MGKRARFEPVSSHCGLGSGKDTGDRQRGHKREASSQAQGVPKPNKQRVQTGPKPTKQRVQTGPKPTKQKVQRGLKPTKKKVQRGFKPTKKKDHSQEYRGRSGTVSNFLRGSTSRDEFEAKYKEIYKLGEGGFGSVYAALRRSDYLHVAIKHIPKADVVYSLLFLNGGVLNVPEEVLLMLRAGGGPQTLGQHPTVSLLDWYDLTEEVLLVMERPLPAVDLHTYLYNQNRPLTEGEAKEILRQLVEAVSELHSKRVFHRDLKLENILIQRGPQGLRVRIVDFGCGCTTSCSSYEEFSGTEAYAPPELFREGRYCAGPTSVWQLGAMLFELLAPEHQFSTKKFMKRKLKIKKDLSKECRDFLRSCLTVDPEHRMSLEQLRLHQWF